MLLRRGGDRSVKLIEILFRDGLIYYLGERYKFPLQASNEISLHACLVDSDHGHIVDEFLHLDFRSICILSGCWVGDLRILRFR